MTQSGRNRIDGPTSTNQDSIVDAKERLMKTATGLPTPAKLMRIGIPPVWQKRVKRGDAAPTTGPSW